MISDTGSMGEPSNRVPLFDPDKGLIHVLMDIPVKHAQDLIPLPLYR